MTSFTQVRRLHRLLAAIIGLQLLLWSLSGAYMVLTDIKDIRGNFLVNEQELILDMANVKVSFTDIAAQNPNASQIRLKQTPSGPVYLFRDQNVMRSIAASTGKAIPAPNEALIRERAKLVYTSNDPIIAVTYFDQSAPSEINPRLLPLWRVDFDAPLAPSLYFSATTAELVGKRHHGWRLFDFLWMLHIMDYEARENVQNNLLRVASSLALLLTFSGCLLVWRSLKSPAQQGSI